MVRIAHGIAESDTTERLSLHLASLRWYSTTSHLPSGMSVIKDRTQVSESLPYFKQAF